jgi:FKBP-type peptidyl-prolyl cis-trans isomerase SlyD
LVDSEKEQVMSERTIDVIAQDVVVSMDYSLIVDDQTIDSSDSYGPLEFIQGHKNIIPGLEGELFGMQVGESKEIIVQAVDGYGEYDESAFADIPRNQFPPSFSFEIGKNVRLSHPSGQLITATITEIGENDVRLDLNHPLAGKELKFSATIVSLRMATPEEISAGRVGGGGCSTCGSSEGGCGGGCG